jgi:hypothetical protein
LGILATPVIAFFIVRKLNSLNIGGKVLSGVLITLFLAAIFYTVSMAILLRNGIGPTKIFECLSQLV